MEPIAAAPPGVPHLGFQVAPERPWLVLGAGTLAELLIDFNACPLPGAPPVLRQIVVVRGALLPVFDLAQALGWKGSAKPRLLAIGRGDRAAAVLIHGEPRVLEVRTHEAAAAASEIPAAFAPFVRPATGGAGESIWLFAHEAWFAQAARHSRPSIDGASSVLQGIET
jgi:chemotaxis signal transduction protein